MRGLQLVAAPEDMTADRCERWIDEALIPEGWDGCHAVPLGRRWDGLRVLAERSPWVHIWAWGDRQAGTAPDDVLSDEAQEFYLWIFGQIASLDNWSMGLGYDVGEWADNDDVARWVEWMHDHDLDHHLFGARSHGNSLARMYPSSDFDSYDVHIKSLGDAHRLFPEMARISGGRIPLWAERGRVRPGASDDNKDWRLDDLVEGVRLAKEAGVAAIWSYMPEGSYDAGSRPLPSDVRERLRAVLRSVPPDDCAPKIHGYAKELRAVENAIRQEADRFNSLSLWQKFKQYDATVEKLEEQAAIHDEIVTRMEAEK